jgi:cation:H+ antiporter
MIAVWLAGLVVGVAVAAVASRRAVVAALTVSEVARISPAFIGATVMAVGTDLPEIANSITSALTGHGDINVGDSAGSALTQVTLVLAILCLVAAPIRSDHRTIATIGAITVGALVLDGIVVRDQVFSRPNGLLLVGIWFISLIVFDQLRDRPPNIEPPDRRSAAPYVGRVLLWLAVVAVAATVVVRSFVAVSDTVGVPELLASAVVLALGTSLPELVVDWTALRRGAVALALGDLFGSSLVDATLAIGSGPAIRATVVSADAVTACLIAACGVALATVVMTLRSSHGRRSAAALFVVYLVATGALVVFTG